MLQNTLNMYKGIWSLAEVNKIISVIVIHALDLLLFLILLPFMIWKWISARDHIITILRAIIEIMLELIMWIIFAGVSILMTVIFIFDDVHSSKIHHDIYIQKKYLDTTLSDKCLHIKNSPCLKEEEN